MEQLISKGLYTLRDAARLLGEDTATLRRWAFGYQRGGKVYPALINAELPEIDGVRSITFLELIELLFIKGFRQSGLSWHRIREAARVASNLFQTEHPFAMRRWFADPVGIYAELRTDTDEEVLVELSGGAQVVIEHALEPYLRQLDFDVDGFAKRWYPLGKEVPISLDPTIAFGAPVIDGTRIETAVLVAMLDDGQSVDDIAWWYELDPWQVDAAVRFERERLAA